MAVAPIGTPGTPWTPPAVPSPASTPASSSTGGVGGTQQSSFAQSLQGVSDLVAQADGAGAQLATGQLSDIHQFTLAASKASLAVELTAALRNKAVESYQEIMRMQV